MKRLETPPSQDRAGVLAGVIRELQLCWRLWRDPRVPLWSKAIPLAAVLYVLFPLDLIVDPLLGLGQLDDLAILILGMELFVNLSPAEVVEEIRRELRIGHGQAQADGGAPAVDAEYRVVEDAGATKTGATQSQ